MKTRWAVTSLKSRGELLNLGIVGELKQLSRAWVDKSVKADKTHFREALIDLQEGV